jgi:hypothetical protein
MMKYLAQVNIARIKAPLDSAIMFGFVARLEKINALADSSPGPSSLAMINKQGL